MINSLNRSDDIDLINLFKKGAEVPWPGSDHNGFLSYKYCKALWTLGVRTTMSNEQSIKIIEDIITCINVYNLSRFHNPGKVNIDKNLYIKAYGELTTYLRYLFVYYNSLISNEELQDVDNPFINYLLHVESNYDEIIIITYNYDIWLERILLLKSIPFCVEGIEEHKDEKIKIIKPHGSISFSFSVKANGPFTIKYSELDDLTQDISLFELKYELQNDYPILNAIIPPAGDSGRYSMGWIKTLHEIIVNKLTLSQEKDKLIIFGVSYSHVDRQEIDQIIIKINPNIDVIYIDPAPPTCFDSVLTSLFKNYLHFSRFNLMEV